EWLASHGRWLAWSGAILGLSEGEALWAQYHRQMGDVPRAHKHAEHALAHAKDPRQPLALLAAHRLLGELDAAAGRYADAHAHIDASLALADACAAPYERALTLLASAQLYAAMKDATATQEALAEARSICARLGARLALAQADALAARIAATTDVPPVYPAGLSAREVEVLRLLASGKTNREMAAALFLSERTIDAHVRNILTKTRTDNRAAATAFAFQHHLA
ncbi:MAG: LuxR C-terminal-related transcriptional regulator, partial [Candidatus Dormibacteraeota bacterium]|nr:LuxR C-terminal-related transcriptional regulator [Candidatus Dormibacteraeota bacterium]